MFGQLNVSNYCTVIYSKFEKKMLTLMFDEVKMGFLCFEKT